MENREERHQKDLDAVKDIFKTCKVRVAADSFVRVARLRVMCLYTNADQIHNKMHEFTARLKVLPLIHIVGITEVKSKNRKRKMIPVEFNLDDIDYNIFSRNIDNDIGRGLLLYVHKSLEVKFNL